MTPKEVLKTYESATGSQDLDKTLGLVDEAALFWFSDGGSHAGHDAIKSVLQRNFAAIEARSMRLARCKS